MNITDTRLRAAVHEAGHAVAFFAAGYFPFNGAKIDDAHRPPADYSPFWSMRGMNTQEVDRVVCCILAGLAAERIVFGGDYNTEHAIDDITEALYLLEDHTPAPWETIHRKLLVAERTLSKPEWRVALDAVTAILCEQNGIRPVSMKRAIERAQRDAGMTPARFTNRRPRRARASTN